MGRWKRGQGGRWATSPDCFRTDRCQESLESPLRWGQPRRARQSLDRSLNAAFKHRQVCPTTSRRYLLDDEGAPGRNDPRLDHQVVEQPELFDQQSLTVSQRAIDTSDDAFLAGQAGGASGEPNRGRTPADPASASWRPRTPCRHRRSGHGTASGWRSSGPQSGSAPRYEAQCAATPAELPRQPAHWANYRVAKHPSGRAGRRSPSCGRPSRRRQGRICQGQRDRPASDQPSAATPGRVFPSNHSRKAPPAVET